MGLRTWATLREKWIAGRAGFSGHSDDKHSKDLLACPDQINLDRAWSKEDAGYIDKEMDCGTHQLFGAFRPQAF